MTGDKVDAAHFHVGVALEDVLEPPRHFVFDQLDVSRGGAVHEGHILNDADLLLSFELFEDAGGAVGGDVGQHQGDNLRAFVLENGEQVLVIGFVEERELPALEGFCNLRQERGGGGVAERLFQDGPGVFQTALGNRLVHHAHLVELGQHGFADIHRQEAEPCDFERDHFHVFGVHVLIDEGGFVGAEGDDDGGGFLESGHIPDEVRRGRSFHRVGGINFLLLLGLLLLLDFLRFGLLGLALLGAVKSRHCFRRLLPLSSS